MRGLALQMFLEHMAKDLVAQLLKQSVLGFKVRIERGSSHVRGVNLNRLEESLPIGSITNLWW